MSSTSKTVKIHDLQLNVAPGWMFDITVDAQYQWEDNGIGSYEFWGQRCNDVNHCWEWVGYSVEEVSARHDDGTEFTFKAQKRDPAHDAELNAKYGVDIESIVIGLTGDDGNAYAAIEQTLTEQTADMDPPEPSYTYDDYEEDSDE